MQLSQLSLTTTCQEVNSFQKCDYAHNNNVHLHISEKEAPSPSGADGDYQDFSAFWALALTFSKCQLPFSNYMYAPHQREVKCDASMNETRVILQCQERQGSVDYDRRPRGPRAETLGQHLWLIRHSKLHKQSS